MTSSVIATPFQTAVTVRGCSLRGSFRHIDCGNAVHARWRRLLLIRVPSNILDQGLQFGDSFQQFPIHPSLSSPLSPPGRLGRNRRHTFRPCARTIATGNAAVTLHFAATAEGAARGGLTALASPGNRSLDGIAVRGWRLIRCACNGGVCEYLWG